MKLNLIAGCTLAFMAVTSFSQAQQTPPAATTTATPPSNSCCYNDSASH